ncbi:uncharacterized protein MYCGRDRAFT_97872 [Zymoseptoria tritici IPO323]|uniref:Uncharacterized protein n=1 Tax=Zymoseptoria tritici (strain CBS 115943 / IPO323) TaxID=336722 RepID=F9XRM7_ZYMTI|nr:uncharacterized protein MYCGRDRAFT_97872 [Zymoseptoria tritici IPO323]EGP82061.1 hypothetical protein MYCGRDRAFT_97872 [Zymoseptoria tritici IPO323]
MSINPFINGQVPYEYDRSKCGKRGHDPNQCMAQPLQSWEQSFLWNMISQQRKAHSIRMGYGQQQQDTPPRNNSMGAPNTPAAPRPATDAHLVVESMNGDKSPQELLDCIRFVEVDSDDEEMEQAKVLAVGFKRARVDEDDGEQDARMADQPRKPAINILAILATIMVTILITWLMQLSPFFRDETKRLVSQPRMRESKTKDKNVSVPTTATQTANATGGIFNTGSQNVVVQMEGIDDDEVLMTKTIPQRVAVDHISTAIRKSINLWKYRDSANRAFGVPATITGTHGRQAVVPRNQVAADQGSEINLIYPHLRKALGLKLRDIGEIDLPPMDMSTANGGLTPLKHFVIFNLNVEANEQAENDGQSESESEGSEEADEDDEDEESNDDSGDESEQDFH